MSEEYVRECFPFCIFKKGLAFVAKGSISGCRGRQVGEEQVWLVRSVVEHLQKKSPCYSSCKIIICLAIKIKHLNKVNLVIRAYCPLPCCPKARIQDAFVNITWTTLLRSLKSCFAFCSLRRWNIFLYHRTLSTEVDVAMQNLSPFF